MERRGEERIIFVWHCSAVRPCVILCSCVVGTSQTVSRKHVLIMDEVDGMAGNEDRGGIQVLVHLPLFDFSVEVGISIWALPRRLPSLALRCLISLLVLCFHLQEMISLIKTSKIPIICMCNDRNHQKIRSLANYCFDLRFQRPRLEQIKVILHTHTHTHTLVPRVSEANRQRALI